MSRTRVPEPKSSQVSTGSNSQPKLNWFTSRNTIIGSAIIAGVGVLGYGVRTIITIFEHKVKKRNDNRAEMDIIDYRKNSDLELLREKYAIRAEFERQDREFAKEEEKTEYSFHSPSDYLSKEYDMHPLIGNLIPEGFDALLYGMKNTMKSYVALGTMIQVALGEKPKILSPQERDAYQSPENVYCIYADGENGGIVFKDRYQAICKKLDGKLEIIEAETYGNDPKWLIECVKSRCLLQPSGTSILLCIDNIKSLLNDMSQNAGRTYLNDLKRLRNTLKEHNINLTTITICHTEKTGEKISGSYNLQCLTPVVIRLDEGDDYDHLLLTLENSRTDLKGQTRLLVVRKDEYKYLEYEEPNTAQKPTEEDPILAEARKIKAFLDAGHSKTEASKEFDLSRPTINHRLALLD